MGNDVLKMIQNILNNFYKDEKKSKEKISELKKEKRITTELRG